MNPKPNTSYLLARLPVGMSMFGHGFERIPKLQGFVAHMTAPFGKTMLPMSLVTLFAQVLPFFELLTGILVLLGLFTRFGCILGVVIMLALIFGSCLLEQWENVFTQIIYGAYFALLYYFAPYNRYSIDQLLGLI
jgi:thiosulfate dehydrogenase [quinone] large subunit